MILKSSRFYPELWIHAGVYGIVAGVGTLPLLSLFVLAYFVFSETPITVGIVIVTVLVAITFGLAFFILARGCWQLFINKVRYIQKYARETGDETLPGKTTVRYKADYTRQGQFLLRPLKFEASGREWVQEVRAVSPLAFFSFLEEGQSLEGNLRLKNGEPFLFEFGGRRLWTVPATDRDLPSSAIGGFIQRAEDKSYGMSEKR